MKQIHLRVANMDYKKDAARLRRSLESQADRKLLQILASSAAVRLTVDEKEISRDDVDSKLEELGFPVRKQGEHINLPPFWKNPEQRRKPWRLPLQSNASMIAVTLLIILTIGVAGCGRTPTKTVVSRSPVEPIQLTDANFQAEVLESELPVLVDMWAPWCQPCIAMKPTIGQLASELSGKVKVAELNIEENPFIKEKYNVDKYPMLLIFVDGKEVERLVGLKSKGELNNALRVYKRDQLGAAQ